MNSAGSPVSPDTGAPPVMRNTMPRTSTMVPSVVMKGLTLRKAMMRPFASPTAAPAAIPASDAGRDPGLQHHHRRDAARERGGRADREIEAAADDDEGHADGDDRHDRGLHQDVGEVERREKAVGHERGRRAQHDQRDQRHLAGESSPIARFGHHQPPIAARSFGSSRPGRDRAWPRCGLAARPARSRTTARARRDRWNGSARRRRGRRNRGSARGSAPWPRRRCLGSAPRAAARRRAAPAISPGSPSAGCRRRARAP